jgi:competence protein ComEA
MIDRIKDYFSFTRKEQRGVLVLLGLLLLIIAADIFLPILIPAKTFDISSFREEVEKFKASIDSTKTLNNSHKYSYNNDIQDNKDDHLEAFLAAPYPFDPNKLTEQQWIDMGMDRKIVHNIIRYREKGGKFRNAEGFRKIYGMTDSVYAVVGPYLKFEDKNEKPEYHEKYSGYDTSNFTRKNYKKTYNPDTVKLELNKADSAALLSLTGIGPSFAGRIVKYRNRLGGFYKKEQLLEINGMDSLRYNQFKNQLEIDTAGIQKIDLNAVTFKDLLKHPYFEYYLVKAIFKYKDEIKRYDSVEQLKGISVMYGELYDKISPYLLVK